MKTIDDTTLMAYTDGELDADTSAQVEAVLAANPALRAKVRNLSESTSLVRAAFNHIVYEPTPELDLRKDAKASTVSSLRGREKTYAVRFHRAVLPLAASLAALFIGGLGGAYMAHHASGEGFIGGVGTTTSDEVAMRQVFTHVLEKEVSGTQVNWNNSDTGNSGAFIPVRTYRAKSGQYCREFEEIRVVNGISVTERGIACRQEDGHWRVRVRYYPE